MRKEYVCFDEEHQTKPSLNFFLYAAKTHAGHLQVVPTETIGAVNVPSVQPLIHFLCQNSHLCPEGEQYVWAQPHWTKKSEASLYLWVSGENGQVRKCESVASQYSKTMTSLISTEQDMKLLVFLKCLKISEQMNKSSCTLKASHFAACLSCLHRWSLSMPSSKRPLVLWRRREI